MAPTQSMHSSVMAVFNGETTGYYNAWNTMHGHRL